MSQSHDTGYPLVRRLGPGDIDRVYAIEQSAYPYPWSRGNFVDCMRVGYPCIGLQAGNELVAYAIYSQAAGEAHLLNLCVHPELQRRGYGGLLLDHVLGEAAAHGCESMFLEVRASNPQAAALYESRGFSVVGRRKAYYRAGEAREDAIVMKLGLEPRSS